MGFPLHQCLNVAPVLGPAEGGITGLKIGPGTENSVAITLHRHTSSTMLAHNQLAVIRLKGHCHPKRDLPSGCKAA